MAAGVPSFIFIFLLTVTFLDVVSTEKTTSISLPDRKEVAIDSTTATTTTESSVEEGVRSGVSPKADTKADKSEEKMEDSSSDKEDSSEESVESDEKTCSLTLEIPMRAIKGCHRIKWLEENIEKIKHDFSARLEVLEDRVQNVLSDEGERNSFQHLEDKVYKLQVQLDSALDLNKHGSRHPVLNRIIQNLRRERGARAMLVKRLQELEKRNQDIDCRLMGRAGVYLIRPFRGPGKMKVYCDNTWTVIQRRLNGSVDFFRNWESYRKGFGNMDGEFWLGNDNIHYLTTQSKYRLRIEMTDWYDRQYFAEYAHFWIESVNNKFRLHVQGFTGNLVDSLHRENSKFNHNGMDFSTHDQDNGRNPNVNCATTYQGAWWYNDCYASNLNGRFCRHGDPNPLSCIVWYGMLEKHFLQQVTMKIKENI